MLSITSVQTQGTTPIDYLAIGPFFAPNNADVMQPAFDVWVDELIVGFTQAPTCVD